MKRSESASVKNEHQTTDIFYLQILRKPEPSAGILLYLEALAKCKSDVLVRSLHFK